MSDFCVKFFSLPGERIYPELFPLLHIRSEADLVVGCWSLKERIQEYLRENEQESSVFFRGVYGFEEHVSLSFRALQEIFQNPGNILWKLSDGTIAAYHLRQETAVSLSMMDTQASLDIEGFPWEEEKEVILPYGGGVLSSIEALWQTHEKQLVGDLDWARAIFSKASSPLGGGVILHPKARVHPTAVLEASYGPIYIEEDVEIQALSYIEGPCFIRRGAQILQAKIRSSVIGANCRIGGEVSHSVILPYTNKAHEGYLGHSYLGSWINLGALCTTSDLKNNYHSISLKTNDIVYSTPFLKMGSIIGDFTTLAIGSLLNAGSIIGMGCNLAVPGGFLPQFIPSFTWKTACKTAIYRWEPFIQTLDIRMKRRDQELSSEKIEPLKILYDRLVSGFKEPM